MSERSSGVPADDTTIMSTLPVLMLPDPGMSLGASSFRTMEQHLSFITLAVASTSTSRRFYVDGLGWQPAFEAPGEVIFLPVGPTVMLSLWSREGFVAEVGEPMSGLAPVTLSHNVGSPAEVDSVLQVARAAGGEVSPGEHRDWGGYSGYFSDPDGFRWEVAHNPQPLAEDLLHAVRRWHASKSGISEHT
ncbi:VOC family protein [Allobranchiibius sp. GilTou73]|uniref:VOC family protein n=1 Tax=Allobranchiibius sp. GilTou73 TaxID=2904523 RepID=UPI00351D64B7